MAATGEGIMVLLQDVIEGADSKDLRALLEEAIKAPGPHHLVSDSAQADPRVHVVLTTNDGATFLPKRGFITEHSGLIRDLLAEGDSNGVAKDPVPLPNVAACELTRLLLLLRQDFDATQLERCIGAFDIEGVVALQEAANFMDVRCITVACGGAIARRVREAVDDEERSRLVKLVTPPRLPRELCELWLERFGSMAYELLKLLPQHPKLVTPLAHWDTAWVDKGRFSEHPFNLSNEKELTMLKARLEAVKDSHSASLMNLKLYYGTTDDALMHVKQHTQLMSLDLHDCTEITNAGLAHIRDLTQLTSLDIGVVFMDSNNITDEGLTHIEELKELVLLDVSNCKITDSGLVLLKKLVKLTELNLRGCDQITDVGLAHVKELTQLTALKLGPCNWITDSGVAHLKVLAHLTSLSLRECDQVTDGALAHIKELTQLKSLNLMGCWKITDMGLTHVKQLKRLTSLNVNGCWKITDDSLVQVKELTQLKELHLTGCEKITDVGVAHVKELTELTTLSLSYCTSITDTGLTHVKELTKLTELNLGGCWRITDEGLMHIKELDQLKSLDLFRCEQITDEGGLFASILAGYVDADELARADVTWKLPDGTTLLHAAAQKNKKKAIKALIKRGADVNAVDGTGRTPLQLAIEANATDAMRLLQ